MEIKQLHTIFLSTSGITTDTRTISEGCLFFALKGANFDGNTYAANAIELGASHAIIDKKEIVNDNEAYIFVEDVLECLQKLANYHRRYLNLPIIGITGSNGKTTTKELLATALSPKYNLYYTQGNFNNHIGVPLTLLNLNKSHQIAVIEMGANHPFEIKELCKICEPNIGIITNIGKAHLEGFGGIEGVIKTKRELYEFIADEGEYVFTNAQDKLLMDLSKDIRRVLYNSEDSAFRVNIASTLPTLSLEIVHKDKTSILKTQLVGEYNAINIAAALEIGYNQGLQYEAMKEALEAYTPNNNRSQVVKTQSNTIILDAYNANPASMEVSISNFIKQDTPNKVLLLGAMKELGTYSKSEHQAIINKTKDGKFCYVAFVGNEYAECEPAEGCHFFNNTQELARTLSETKITDSTILIKGSRSMKMESLTKIL